MAFSSLLIYSSVVLFFFFDVEARAHVVPKPCAMHSIEEVRNRTQMILTDMRLNPSRPIRDFNVDPTTLQSYLHIFNLRSFYSRTSVNGSRQFCNETMRLNVDLSREPAVIFEAQCKSEVTHPSGSLQGRVSFSCVQGERPMLIRYRVCNKRGGRTISEEIKQKYLKVAAGCRLECHSPLCV